MEAPAEAEELPVEDVLPEEELLPELLPEEELLLEEEPVLTAVAVFRDTQKSI